ncbi:MAG: prolyl oligopeptidase family serine peptidase [Acidobacteriota bacterium]|nr:prolyl oligopeptidase family serine peptidase [Acidobacteriota bacterium]
MTNRFSQSARSGISGALLSAAVFLALAALLIPPAAAATLVAGQTAPPAQTEPQAKPQPTPGQIESQRIQKQINDLEKRLSELRNEGMARRYVRDVEAKKKDDDLVAKLAGEAGIGYAKIAYPSSVDKLTIPAYLFTPLAPRGPKGHAALVWVHGGVHSSFSSSILPFIHQAVDRGYIVIAPDYRGSTGYGKAFHEAIDYGGYEIDDAMSAIDYLKAFVPAADPDRLGMIGWSHGGFITLHSLIRDQGKILKCGYAGVPVTNLVFRLGYKGPSYEAEFFAQKRIGGHVYQRQALYIERSPVYHVDKIKVPVAVHVATNDQDVNFVEDQMMIHALEYHIPELAETKIYVDPPGGHSFERLVNADKTEPQNTPPQVDGWKLIWAFLEKSLKPDL